MNDYKKFLAAEILTEGKLVTYRLLSRALKVHVNKAKHMLFAFHESQNGQTPDSVHATYLVYGEKTEDEVNDDEDVEMSSSADAEPLSEPTRALTLTLVQEDKLKNALALYKTVLSVQIFSLGPHPTKDLQLLSDANHRLAEYSNDTGSSNPAEGYGGISNSSMRRKERKGPNPAMASTSAKTQPPSQKPAPVPTKAPTIPQIKNKAADSPSSSQGTSGTSAPSKEKPVSSGVKARSGGIMQSFAKAAASKKESKPKPTPQRAPSPETKAPSMAMESDDDDGEEDHPAVLPQPKAPSESAAARKAREERKAELTRMMEEEEESEAEEAPSSPDEAPEEPPQDLEEAESKGVTEKEEDGQGDSQGGEVVSSVGSGRRRGKRKVIKKKQVEDEDGYLITVRETGWESFSEDEEAPQPQKAATPTIPSTGGSTKAKKPAPKGQGSIMSFFAKK